MSMGAARLATQEPAAGRFEHVSPSWEDEDLKLAPIALMLTTSGTLAIVLALLALSTNSNGASALAPAALVLLSSGHALTAARPWSVRLGQVACLLAAAVWLLTLTVVNGAGEITCFCLAMVGATEYARRFLGAQLQAPEWTLAPTPAMAEDPLRLGWIEDLPEATPDEESPIGALR